MSGKNQWRENQVNEDKKHVKIKTFLDLPDGSIQATTESYYESLASIKEEIIKQIPTNRDKLLADVISCLDIISKQQTRDCLTIRVYMDEWGQPNRVEKQYTTKKENYKKR